MQYKNFWTNLWVDIENLDDFWAVTISSFKKGRFRNTLSGLKGVRLGLFLSPLRVFAASSTLLPVRSVVSETDSKSAYRYFYSFAFTFKIDSILFSFVTFFNVGTQLLARKY